MKQPEKLVPPNYYREQEKFLKFLYWKENLQFKGHYVVFDKRNHTLEGISLKEFCYIFFERTYTLNGSEIL